MTTQSNIPHLAINSKMSGIDILSAMVRRSGSVVEVDTGLLRITLEIVNGVQFFWSELSTGGSGHHISAGDLVDLLDTPEAWL